jgi:antitoxin ParD1/3/4
MSSGYMSKLKLELQKKQAEARLDQLLLEGLCSGEPVEVTPELWVKKRLALVERHQKKFRP